MKGLAVLGPSLRDWSVSSKHKCLPSTAVLGFPVSPLCGWDGYTATGLMLIGGIALWRGFHAPRAGRGLRQTEQRIGGSATGRAG
jgi:hypothetical protein